MKLSKIQELLRIVQESGVAEVEIEEEDFKLTIRQSTPQVVMQPSYPMQMPYGGAPAQQPMQQPMQAHGGGAPQPPSTAQPPQGAPSGSGGGAASTPTADGAAESTQNGEDTTATDDGYVVQAPIVGTFYRAPSPDSDPYVEVGDTVAEGDVLCIIEAMKLMNEIECETSGTIREILVENAEPVEFDQPLFVIDES